MREAFCKALSAAMSWKGLVVPESVLAFSKATRREFAFSVCIFLVKSQRYPSLSLRVRKLRGDGVRSGRSCLVYGDPDAVLRRPTLMPDVLGAAL
jgi:hypothetical protein